MICVLFDYRDYASITSSDARPLGFKKYTVIYGDASQNPCIKVNDAANRGIEIMVSLVFSEGAY